MDQYAPVDESDLQTYEFGFFSSDQPNPYTTTAHTLLNRHATELKPITDVTLQPLHQINRKRLRELALKQSNQLFSFAQHPEPATQPLLKADAIFQKYGQDAPAHFDLSMNDALKALEDGLAKSTGQSASVPLIAQQLKHLCQQYKTVGEEVIRLEALLTQKTQLLDKLHDRQNIVLNLKNNEALPGLLDAFGSYMTEVFKEANFEATYKELMHAHKQWSMLREFLTVHQLMITDKKDPMCAICLTEPVTHCVAPCGHTFCGGCVRRLTMSCYLCRGTVRERVKLYFT